MKAQEQLITDAKKKLGMTTKQLASELRVSEDSVKSWLAPARAEKRREMPEAMKLLLGYVVADVGALRARLTKSKRKQK